MNFWDLAEKVKSVEFDFKGNSVTQAVIDPSGDFMAYSLGYDWARGIQGYMTQPPKICVHPLLVDEFKVCNYLEYPLKY